MDNLKPLITLVRNESTSPWCLVHSVIMAPESDYTVVPVDDTHQLQSPGGDPFPGVKVELHVTKNPSAEALNIMTPLVHIFKLKSGLTFDLSNPFIEITVIEDQVDPQSGTVTHVTKNKSIVRHQDADIDDAD